MQILPRSVLQVLAARLFAVLSANNPHAGMPEINYSAPVGGRPLLPRGQAAARGIIIGPSRGSRPKLPSVRRLHRLDMQVAREMRATYPDFSAQIAAEAKQARGRAARAARMGG